MRKSKLLVALLLASTLFSSCSPQTMVEQDIGTVNVWTASATEKLLQDVDYSSRYSSKALEISAFRNEYESAQIMISVEKETGVYTVETATLKNKNGDELSKDAFEVYHEKYIKVSEIKDANAPTSIGMYPDALVPMDAAEKCKANNVSGKNQGVWVTLQTPADQPAGTYTGTFCVKVNNKSYNVPVSVTVYDYTLSTQTHTKTSFAIDNEMLGWGELDTSVEMYEAYYEYLLDYRISAQHLPGNELTYVLPEGESLERFLYYADKYTRDDRCSTYNLPFNITYASVLYNGSYRSIRSVDFENFEVLLREMATYSAENGVDLFKKASTYFIFFDEYDLNDNAIEANYNLNKAVELCETLAEELKGTLDCENTWEEEILLSLANIKHKVVGSLTEELNVEKAVVVPLINKYHTEDGRNMYQEFTQNCYGDDGELWAYTCLSPRTPNPTYHIEDVLISSRLMGWMMYDYDIVGNLYWMTNLYSWRESAFGDYPLQDYYDTALRYPDANGDGFLLYPGRPYGVDGPIGSVRLQSIRDSIEDYDLTYALEELYQAKGVSEEAFDSLMNLLTRNLYTGTLVRIRDSLLEDFAESRETLASLLELAYNTGTVIKNVEKNLTSVTVTLQAGENVELYQDGAKLTPVSGNEYAVTVSMSNVKNFLALTAKTENASYDLALNLGGRSEVINGTSLLPNITMVTAGETSIDTINGVEALKISYAADERLIAQVDVSAWRVDDKVNTVTLNIYSYSFLPINLKILSKAKNSQAFIESTSITLKKGWNKIEIPITAFNCAALGSLTALRFNIDSTRATDIAIGEITIGG